MSRFPIEGYAGNYSILSPYGKNDFGPNHHYVTASNQMLELAVCLIHIEGRKERKEEEGKKGRRVRNK